MSAPGSAGSGVPHLDVDPFDMTFFADPYPTHELLREAGPVVYLDKWKVYGTIPQRSAPAAESVCPISRRKRRGGRRA